MLGRLVIDQVRPRALDGDHPAKASVGERVPVRAWIHRDGHDLLAARLLWRVLPDDAGPTPEPGWHVSPMQEQGNDEWTGTFTPTENAMHEFAVEAWANHVGTWAREVVIRRDAGDPLDVEFLDGARRCERLAGAAVAEADRDVLSGAATALRRHACTDDVRIAAGTAPEVLALAATVPDPYDRAVSLPQFLWVDRERARAGAWYELFPRSEGGLLGTIDRLPAVATMGFDVLYLPPIHPIGKSARKGRNNTLVAGADDPGSPWAIGSPDGGHLDIDPSLGTVADFERLVAAAREEGIEIALDYALQCSPDHPWVMEHPTWFHWRPDGSIRYAENPPKKYQDIYPINFWPVDPQGRPNETARQELWLACKEILDVWIERGVRIFRVDNPHTKPMALWEWLIPAVQAQHPDVLFLAEAFTRPKVMSKLAEVGFTQSYTYFTWRHSKEELRDYVEELAGDQADWLRPNFWPNTPDILGGILRRGDRAAFELRATLAALLAPNWGLYSGYELCENEPASESNEEYFNSEKYEIKHRDWDAPDSLAPYIGRLNAIRRRFPAFAELRGTRFHHTDEKHILAWSKTDANGGDPVVVVANLDPGNVRSATVWLDLPSLGLAPDATFVAYDLMSGGTFDWHASPWVQLDPQHAVAHVIALRPDPDASPAPVAADASRRPRFRAHP